jgi:hypothetical protein
VALALALGDDPAALPRAAPSAGAAASLVWRAFSAAELPPMPNARQRAALSNAFPDALLFTYPKQGHALERDFKWLDSCRYGIVHLGGRDADDLRARCEHAAALLGWPNAPYAAEPSAATAEPASPAAHPMATPLQTSPTP